MQIELTGEVRIRAGAREIAQADLGGRRARIALALLTLERRRPVPREELAEALWPDGLPPTWQAALRGAVSSVRACLIQVGLHHSESLVAALGCYHLRLPAVATVDVESAAQSVAAAGAALREEKPESACTHAILAEQIAERPFLAGEDGTWVREVRRALRGWLLRALDAQSAARTRLGDAGAAIEAAERAVALDPLRETAHRSLMAAHAAGGDRAGALEAFGRCRRVLAEELGVEPSAETAGAYLRLLHEDEPLTPRATGSARVADARRQGIW